MITEGTLSATKVGRDFVILEKNLETVTVYGKPGRPLKKKNESE